MIPPQKRPFKYRSRYRKLSTVELPPFSGTRVLMLPFRMEDSTTLPNDLAHYTKAVVELVSLSPVQTGVAYLTIDENVVRKGNTLRKGGLHIDGVGPDHRPSDCSIWATAGIRSYVAKMWNEGAKKWMHGAAGIGGMITVSNPAGCRAYYCGFDEDPKMNGDCEHLRDYVTFNNAKETIFEANTAYWCSSACLHESLPVEHDMARTFVRLSMPNKAPWYAGYTKNPKGIEPTGVIITDGPWRPKEPEVVLKG